MKLKNALIYLRCAGRALAQRPRIATLNYAVRYARRCIATCERPQPDFLADPKPWMCFPAVEQLERLVNANARVFEYGSGGSTIFFARRAAEVVSVEHDQAWHQRILAEIDRLQLANVRYELVEPEVNPEFERGRIADPHAYVSDDERYIGKTFRNYAQAIDAFPDGYFDVVIVDGRARPSCILHARSKVRPGGVLILDQSERRYYLAQGASLLDPAQWRSARYMAPQPCYLHFTEAAFFYRSER
jgi:hypothetical protein